MHKKRCGLPNGPEEDAAVYADLRDLILADNKWQNALADIALLQLHDPAYEGTEAPRDRFAEFTFDHFRVPAAPKQSGGTTAQAGTKKQRATTTPAASASVPAQKNILQVVVVKVKPLKDAPVALPMNVEKYYRQQPARYHFHIPMVYTPPLHSTIDFGLSGVTATAAKV